MTKKEVCFYGFIMELRAYWFSSWRLTLLLDAFAKLSAFELRATKRVSGRSIYKYRYVLHWCGRSSLVIHLVLVLGTCIWNHKIECHGIGVVSQTMAKCKPRDLLLVADHTAFNVALQKWWIGWRFLETRLYCIPLILKAACASDWAHWYRKWFFVLPMQAWIWKDVATTVLVFEMDDKYSHWESYQRISLSLGRSNTWDYRKSPLFPPYPSLQKSILSWWFWRWYI